MTYSAVIFDLDGTLTDSAPGILNCIRYALDKMGFPAFDDKVLRKFLGPPLTLSFVSYCGMSEDQAIEATGFYRERYQRIGWKENKVYPGIRALLSRLKQEGVYLGVATGKPQLESEKILAHFHLSQYFDTIAGPSHSDYYAKKSDLIKRSLAGHQGRAVMVGDRDLDIQGAKELGIGSIAALYGYGSSEELTGCRPDAYAARPEDLFDALGIARQTDVNGYFISLEGNDGSGKSTQAALLYERLLACGYDIIKTREPGGTDVAEKIRAILLDRDNIRMQDMTEALLYAAARAQHVREVIKPALSQGKIVLTDRYVDSSIAYQGAGRGLGVDLVKQMNQPAIDGCLPDLTLLLVIDAQAAILRRNSATGMDRIEMMDADFHARVEKAFQQLSEQNPQRILKVDASGTPQQIAEAVEALVFERLRQHEGI